jgi:hypothetical protein
MDWYKVIHDILPTKERLQRVNITATDQCSQCQAKDTLQHHLLECGDGQQIWRWTQGRIAIMLRMNAKNIPGKWTMCPNIRIWPPTWHRALLWMIAQLVTYRTQQRHKLTWQDYYDFLQRTKRKLYK